MPTSLEPPARKIFTREEVAVLEASPLFVEQRMELVEGELISKTGKKRPHVNTSKLMRGWLTKTFGDVFVDTDAPIDVAGPDNPINEPEPDLIVLSLATTSFAANPQPEEVRLLVEVADSSLLFDLSVKARLYARAGIVEYWVVDVNSERIVVHREPRDGRYESIVAYAAQESVAPLAAPDQLLTVGSLFSK